MLGLKLPLARALPASPDDLERLRRHNAYLAWLKSTLESSRGKAAAPATAPLALRRCRVSVPVLLLLLPLPGTDPFAFGLAEALEHRLEAGKLKAIIARIANKTGPRAAR